MKNSFLKAILFCLLTILTSLSSCKKEEDKQPDLPPETTSGANTAGFVVNDKIVVLPTDKYSSAPGTGLVYGLSVLLGQNFGTDGNDYLTVRIANIKDPITYGIDVRLSNLKNGVGTYPLGQSNGEAYSDGPDYPQVTLIISGKNTKTKWYYSGENSGNIIMTKVDTKNDYYAGTFDCTLYNKDDLTDTIKITKGRFDIDVKTLNK